MKTDLNFLPTRPKAQSKAESFVQRLATVFEELSVKTRSAAHFGYLGRV